MPINNRLYEAKDLRKILGLRPETIYLWLRTWRIFEPTQRASGVRGKNKYSLLDIVKLMLIDRLLAFGMSLLCMQGIFAKLDKVDNGKSLWELIVNERNRFDRDGAILIITRGKDVDWNIPRFLEITGSRLDPNLSVSLLSYDEAVNQFKKESTASAIVLVVNIMNIVTWVESVTDKRLG